MANRKKKNLDMSVVIMVGDGPYQSLKPYTALKLADGIKSKGININKVKDVVNVLKHYVKVAGFFIIGVPGETINDIKETINLAKELELDKYSFSLFTPLPGSPLYETLKKNGILSNLLDEGNDSIPFDKYENMHFTESSMSFCDVPAPELREIYTEVNNYFSKK